MELELGCGAHKRPGALGLDMLRLPDVDVVHEHRRGIRLPFENSRFDAVYMSDFVEHVDDIAWLLAEVHRVTAQDGLVHIRYPHFSNANAKNDVTHRRFLGLRAFDHFDPSTEYGMKYQYFRSFDREFPFTIESKEIEWPGSAVGKLGARMYGLVGADRFEKYVASALPMENVNLRLRVMK